MVVIPFGRYKGRPLGEVPLGYLQWALRECKLGSGLRAALEVELRSRGCTPTPQPGPVAPPVKACSRCGDTAARCTWLQNSRGTRLVRRECSRCGNFMGFAPRCSPWTAEADRNSSPTAVLDALLLAEDLGVLLKSDGAAADFATSADYRRATPELHGLLRQCRHSLGGLLGRTEAT